MSLSGADSPGSFPLKCLFRWLSHFKESRYVEGGEGGGPGEAERQRPKSLFDWPVAFTKVILIVANCTLAKPKCSEERKK